MNTIIIYLAILISGIFVYLYLWDKDRKANKGERYLKKSQTTKKRIDNINKHLKIADASKNLYEVRIHAREAMRLIKKYGLINHYRDLLRSKQ